MNPPDKSPRAQLNIILSALSDARSALYTCEDTVEGVKDYYRRSPKSCAGKALEEIREKLTREHEVEATLLEAALEDFCETLELAHDDDSVCVRWSKVKHSRVLVLSCSRNDGEDRDFTPAVNEGESGPLFLNLDGLKAEVLQWMSEAVPESAEVGAAQ